jgi:hypothetical protein
MGVGVFMSASYLTICGIATERFLVVRYPFLSRKCEARPYKSTFIVFCWLMPILCWVPIMMCCEVDALNGVYAVRIPPALSYSVTLLFQYIPLIIMLVLYILLLRTLKQGFYVQPSRTFQGGLPQEMSSVSGGMFPHTEQKQQFSARRHFRAARLLGALIVAFVVCWMPWTLVWPIYTSRQATVSNSVVKVFLGLSFLNSAVNPFLYAFMSKDFRAAVHRLVCCAAENRFGQSSRSFPLNQDPKQRNTLIKKNLYT